MLTARNKVAPQMAEYDQVGDQWVPYLMLADGANKVLTCVTTDRWGLRQTIGRDGSILAVDTIAHQPAGQAVGVVVGSSAVFGVGSTQDRYTIPSYLSGDTTVSWLNFGGRAYNSTQEWIRLGLHLPSRIDHIVVMSGVNNLVLAFLSQSTSAVYNSFFSQSRFERAMRDGGHEHIGVRRALRQLVGELRNKLMPAQVAEPRTTIAQAYGDVMSSFERDLRVAKALAAGSGATLSFVLQPLATWLDKPLSAEERAIFAILDRMSMDWQVMADHLKGLRERYFKDMEEACRRLQIPYCNLNQTSEFLTAEWLFVDRVHLTDRGCHLAAKVIKREFNL